jgi:hypothetical protein
MGVECRQEGCARHPSNGDLIIRTSPKGQPFEGACEEHYEGQIDPTLARVADALQEAE